MTPTIFDYLDAISYTKADLEIDPTVYKQFLINNFLSSNVDTIFFAYEVSMCPDISDEMHFSFLKENIRKRKRRFTFRKQPKRDDQEILDAICTVYKCSLPKAIEYKSLLSDIDIHNIMESVNVGGRSTKSKGTGQNKGLPKRSRSGTGRSKIKNSGDQNIPETF